MKTLLPLFILAILFISGCTAAPANVEKITGTAPPTDAGILPATTSLVQKENIVNGSGIEKIQISGWNVKRGTEGNMRDDGWFGKVAIFYKGSNFLIKAIKKDYSDKNSTEFKSVEAGEEPVLGIGKESVFVSEKLFAISKKGSSIVDVRYTNSFGGVSVDSVTYMDTGTLEQDKELLKKIVKAVWAE